MPQFYYSATYKDQYGKDFILVNHVVEADDILLAADIAEIECSEDSVSLLEIRNFMYK
jgi:hypothetical protein